MALDSSEALRDNLTTVSEPVLRAVEKLSRQPRATVADIAAAAGLPLTEASTEAVKLASLTGATIDVTTDGDIAYRFPRDVRASLRRNSLRAALTMTWRRMSPFLFTAARVAFGALLVVSIVVTFVAIAALSAAGSSDDDRREGRSSSSSSSAFLGPRFFGPNVFDVMFYSRPYGYYDYSNGNGRGRRGAERSPDDMSFLEAVYSFVFGDADPNAGFDEARWRAVGRLIRGCRGAVTAEQLAPLLDPPRSGGGDSAASSSNVVDESFVLPALTRFQGRPEVTEDGDIIYVFPSLMTTGARGAGSVEFVGSGSGGAAGGGGGSPPPAVEAEVPLTRADGGQRLMVVALGVVNVVGVAILGTQLLSAVPVTRDAVQLIALVRGIYPLLFAYAASFFSVPLVRFLRLRKRNEDIRQRNRARAEYASLLARGDVGARRKVRAAEAYGVRGGNVTDDGIVYSSDRDAIDQSSVQDDMKEDFDRRLNG